MTNNMYIALIPLLPLVSFLLLGLFGSRYIKSFSGVLGSFIMLATTVLSLFTAVQYFMDGKQNGVYKSVTALKFSWLQFSPGVSIDMGIMLDPISAMMIVVVSVVSLMVHVFSLGYMKGEERYPAYFAFLSLFTFSMTGLVLSTNLLQIYIFWELVGISSYLLIGFYFQKPSAVAASKKAFIVTRFADLGFLIGILVLAFYTGTLDFNTLIERLTTPSTQLLNMATASFMGISMLTWGLMLVFIGGAGKSAMFPLHVWLPDAMEGPTPVSALIHAATMVVAGVYLVARLFPVFAISAPAALQVVLYTGTFSALFAALIACTQTDIKRVLAYSTMSQIGYMMLALGVSGYGTAQGLGYTASMFHLFTHAFFKSLLFLCAGAVIHLVHSNEMKDMGGLRKRMPLTHICFLIACLAIAGIPPFSGFFSKEEILLAAFNDNKFVYGIALLTSGLTAFYMFRLYFCIFWKKDALSDHTSSGTHESVNHSEGTITMKMPLIILAGLVLLTGFIPFSQFITTDGLTFDTDLHLIFSIAPVLLALSGIFLAGWLYKKEKVHPGNMASSSGGLYRLTYRSFYIDDVYQFITKKIIFNGIGRPAAWIDTNIIDRFMNLLATTTTYIAGLIKGLQSGKIQNYVLCFFAGIVGLVVLFIYARGQ